MRFAFSDFRTNTASGHCLPDGSFVPVTPDPVREQRLMDALVDGGIADIKFAMTELQDRVSWRWYRRVETAVLRTLAHARQAYPPYRYFLPEVIANDWLAIVDWRRWQRDHVVHQPLTAYIVMKLLRGDRRQGPMHVLGRPMIEYCIDAILESAPRGFILEHFQRLGEPAGSPWLRHDDVSRQYWRSFFIDTAYAAALFHDMGYPWQYVGILQSRLDAAGLPFGPFTTEPRDVLDTYWERLVMAPFLSYRQPSTRSHFLPGVLPLLQRAMARTHGIPGALAFLYMCREVETPGPLAPSTNLCRDWAALAMANHDLCSIYWGNADAGVDPPDNPGLRLRFKEDPLGTVIAIADLMQGFARPRASFRSHLRAAHVSYTAPCLAVDLEASAADPSQYAITYRYRRLPDPDWGRTLEYMREEEQSVCNPDRGYLDLEGLGGIRIALRATRRPF